MSPAEYSHIGNLLESLLKEDNDLFDSKITMKQVFVQCTHNFGNDIEVTKDKLGFEVSGNEVINITNPIKAGELKKNDLVVAFIPIYHKLLFYSLEFVWIWLLAFSCSIC